MDTGGKGVAGDVLEEILEATGNVSSSDVRAEFAGKRVVGWMLWSESYEEGVCVVARDDAGNWFFLEDSHCSCNGFEGMAFEPSHPDAILAKRYYCYDASDVERLLAAVRAAAGERSAPAEGAGK